MRRLCFIDFIESDGDDYFPSNYTDKDVGGKGIPVDPESIRPFILESKWSVPHQRSAKEFKLDLPFESCWFECADGYLYEEPGNNFGQLYVNGEEIANLGNDIEIELVVKIKGFLIKEWGDTYLIASIQDEFLTNVCPSPLYEDSWQEKYAGKLASTVHFMGLYSKSEFLQNRNELASGEEAIHEMVARFCAKLRSENMLVGSEKIRERIRSGKGKDRKLVKIKELFHIVPRKTRAAYVKKLGSSVKIDWSHRWEVRGHWRKLGDGKIGKDRNGNYTVVGYTWVKPAIKGPEKKPLVKKTRVLRDGTESVPS